MFLLFVEYSCAWLVHSRWCLICLSIKRDAQGEGWKGRRVLSSSSAAFPSSPPLRTTLDSFLSILRNDTTGDEAAAKPLHKETIEKSSEWIGARSERQILTCWTGGLAEQTAKRATPASFALCPADPLVLQARQIQTVVERWTLVKVCLFSPVFSQDQAVVVDLYVNGILLKWMKGYP